MNRGRPPIQTIRFPYLHRPGAAIIRSYPRLPDQQIFSHLDNDGIWRHYYVPDLLELTKQPGIEKRPYYVTEEQARFLVFKQGIAYEHLHRISPERLAEPGIIVYFPDNTELVVDGSHRFVKRWILRKETMDFWRISEEQAKYAQLERSSTLEGIVTRGRKDVG